MVWENMVYKRKSLRRVKEMCDRVYIEKNYLPMNVTEGKLKKEQKY